MYFYFVQQHKTAERSEDVGDTLEAEWESFEKLIQGGYDEQPKQEASEQHSVSTQSSDLSKKPAVGGLAADCPYEVRQKRVFREAESDSDGASNSDAEDESRPSLPAVGMNSASDYKADRRSSSSDSSSRSTGNKFQTKPSSSDSDSSSDDEKPAEQSKVSVSKCQVTVIISSEFV